MSNLESCMDFARTDFRLIKQDHKAPPLWYWEESIAISRLGLQLLSTLVLLMINLYSEYKMCDHVIEKLANNETGVEK